MSQQYISHFIDVKVVANASGDNLLNMRIRCASGEYYSFKNVDPILHRCHQKHS